MFVKSIKSYAKINIALCIKDKREDGYHELDSIMLPVELHDSVIISPLKTAKDNFVTIDDFSRGVMNYNLVGGCLDAMAAKYGFKNKFRIFIHKNIPMQAGLGGGSSNAAFAMKHISEMLKIHASEQELIDIATPLGADIPFFIHNKPVRCHGVGEKMQDVAIKGDYFVLLVKPKAGISTKESFSVCDRKPYKQVDIDKVEQALREGDDDLLEQSIGNSLLDAAVELVPEVQEIIDYLKGRGLKLVSMSGSGSTVFALSRDKNELKRIIPDIEDKWFVELTKVLK